MIQRLDENAREYVPSRGVIMMILFDESEDSDYTPKKATDEGNKNGGKSLVNSCNENNEMSDSDSSGEESETSEEESKSVKQDSSSATPLVDRQLPVPILRRDYAGKGPLQNQPPESWHLVYTKQQQRQKKLLTTVNQRIEAQNSHIVDMNKYLAQAKEISDRQDEKDKIWGENIKRVELEQRKNESA